MKLKLILGIILFIAFTLRVWLLDVIPYGFTPDEASFGYDAYSLMLTGKDQWGKTLPLVLESFGDFKMPLYSYITIPFVWLFGLTKFAVRFPNAILGTAAVYVTFLLVRELFKGNKFVNSLEIRNFKLEIFASFLLAINPWHIMMSRGAFEANLTTLLMPLGAYLFLRGLREKGFLTMSALVFGLNLFSYHSARLVTPLIFFFLLIIYREDLVLIAKKINYKVYLDKLKVPFLVFLIFLTAAFYTLSIGAGRRAKDITIFSGALEEASGERFVAMYQGLSESTARLFHNKFLISAERFLNNYSQYTSYNFLFINGPAEGTYGMIPGRGVLYWFELPLLFFFLYSFFVLKNKKAFIFILLWVLIAPIPAALTTGRGYAGNRAIVMQPALSIALAMGGYTLFFILREKISSAVFKLSLTVFLVTGSFMFANFVEDYFILSPFKNSKEMLYGNFEAAELLSKNSDRASKIVVSKSLSEPHIYIAFANKWDPGDYQENTKNWLVYREKNLLFLDQMEEYSLGKYHFESINLTKYQNEKDVLLVGRPDEFTPELTPSAKLFYPNGEAAVYVVEPFKEAYAGKIK